MAPAERPARPYAPRGRLTGFMKFVVGIALIDLCLGFAWGVLEGPVTIEQPAVHAAKLQRPEQSTAQQHKPPQTPPPDAALAHTPGTQDPANANVAANQSQPPPDPTPIPEPTLVDDQRPPPTIVDDGNEVIHKPGQGLFDFGDENAQPPRPPRPAASSPLVRQADDLQAQSIELFKAFRKSENKADIHKAKQTIERALELYRQAAKTQPNDPSIEKKLKEAKQLQYLFMKHSPI